MNENAAMNWNLLIKINGEHFQNWNEATTQIRHDKLDQTKEAAKRTKK